MFSKEIAENKNAYIFMETEEQSRQYLTWLWKNYTEKIEDYGFVVDGQLDDWVIATAVGDYVNFLAVSVTETVESLKTFIDEPIVLTFEQSKSSFKGRWQRLKMKKEELL